jgi:hypothetical protein
LLNDPESNGPSKELKSALLYFEIYLNAYVVIATVVSMGLYMMGEVPWTNFFIAMVACMGMWLLSWGALAATICSERLRLYTTIIYFAQALTFIIYILATDLRVLAKLTGEENDGYTVNNVIVLISYLLFLREVIFFRYIAMVGLSVFSIFLYIVLFQATKAMENPVILGEFLLLLGAVVLLSADSY